MSDEGWKTDQSWVRLRTPVEFELMNGAVRKLTCPECEKWKVRPATVKRWRQVQNAN